MPNVNLTKNDLDRLHSFTMALLSLGQAHELPVSVSAVVHSLCDSVEEVQMKFLLDENEVYLIPGHTE